MRATATVMSTIMSSPTTTHPITHHIGHLTRDTREVGLTKAQHAASESTALPSLVAHSSEHLTRLSVFI